MAEHLKHAGGAGRCRGYSLLEMLLALALGSLLLLAILALWSGTRSSLNTHQSSLDAQFQAQRALAFMTRQLRMAGYHTQPWQVATLEGLLADSSNSDNGRDVLSLQRLSRLDCHGKALDADDRSRFGLLQMRFSVDSAGARLHWRCQWQPDGGTSVLQVNNQTLIDQVEAQAILYGEDMNGDDLADAWTVAGDWQQVARIRRVRIALLLRERYANGAGNTPALALLDEPHGPWSDHQPRRVFETHVALRNVHPTP